MKKIAIIGGGISGLYIASLLRQSSNYEISVYEKNNSVNLEKGYGIQLSVNSIKLLNKIGFQNINSKEKFCPNKLSFYSSKNKDKIIKQLKSEKHELYKKMDTLLDKVGDTTINTTHNIQLNNYGNEDLSHLTHSLKTELLSGPFGMIPKMIEAVHFNDEKPENKNIIITNSRDNKLKIYKNNKWVYKDKSETLNDLVDNKYFMLDSYFEKVNSDYGYNNDNNDNNDIQNNIEVLNNGDKSNN